MPIKLETYLRKPMRVTAIQITTENMAEVAEWCGGVIVTDDATAKIHGPYIKIHVRKPKDARQTQGRYGDWMLKQGSRGFAVYTEIAFDHVFKKDNGKVQTFTVDPYKHERIEELVKGAMRTQDSYTYNGDSSNPYLDQHAKDVVQKILAID